MAYEIEKQWITKAGFPAVVIVVVRNGINTAPYRSHRCGYVGVDKEHPLHGIDYDGIDVSCHGGLTFAACGTTFDTENPNRWYFGFDCAHYLDGTIDIDPFGFNNQYEAKSLDFCVNECEDIAFQLKNLEQSNETN